jgi:endonuclease/exonuclease/phosphatase family metal-dependent hydrolase
MKLSPISPALRVVPWVLLGSLGLSASGCILQLAPPSVPPPHEEQRNNADDDFPAGGDPLAGDGDQNPLKVGSDATFEIATWNLHNFPFTTQAVTRLAELMQAMELDVVAVEQVANQSSFTELLGKLPGYEGTLSADNVAEYGKLGFIYRSAVAQLTSSQAIFAQDADFPRPALEAQFELTRADGSTLPIALVAVHLMADTAANAQTHRHAACNKLKSHLDELGAGGSANAMLLGDFNDELNDGAPDNIFDAFTSDPLNVELLTAPLDVAGEYSYIPYQHLVDHIAVSAALFPAFAPGSTSIIRLDLTVEDYKYAEVVSDHRPVVAIMPRQ